MSGQTSIVFVVALSLVPILAERLRFLGEEDHSPWLSFSGGAAIAYVFVYVLPKLGYQQLVLADAAAAHPVMAYLHHHAYLVALAGLTVYFGVALVAERLEQTAKSRRPIEATTTWLKSAHIAGFAAYNLLIGYLVADWPRQRVISLLLFSAVMFLHCFGRDHTLAQRYGVLYRGTIRWILVASMFAGWTIGILTTIRPSTVALWFAFLAGSITLNVIEEELPKGNLRQFRPFVGGGGLMTALLLLLEHFLILQPL